MRKRRPGSGDRRRGAGRTSRVEPEKLRELFPFTRLSDAANVLIFPSLAAGNAAYKVLEALGGATAIGPILLGVTKPVTVLPRDANVDTIVAMTAYTVAH